MQPQEAQLPRRLHPFGHHVQVQALRQCQDGAHDGRVVGVGQHVAHEAPVDLDLVQRQAFEVAQAGVPGAEVVQRKPTPSRLSCTMRSMVSSMSPSSRLSVSSSLRRRGWRRFRAGFAGLRRQSRCA